MGGKSEVSLQIYVATGSLVCIGWGFLILGSILPFILTIKQEQLGHFRPASRFICFDSQRFRSHTTIRLYGGVPLQSYKLLLRLDGHGQCRHPSERAVIALHATRALGSASLKCLNNNQSLCAETFLLSTDIPSQASSRPVAAMVQIGLGSLMGHESLSMNLDGEFQLCSDVRMILGASRMCIAAGDIPWTPDPLIDIAYDIQLRMENGWRIVRAVGQASSPGQSIDGNNSHSSDSQFIADRSSSCTSRPMRPLGIALSQLGSLLGGTIL